jgi:hypothetical protein
MKHFLLVLCASVFTFLNAQNALNIVIFAEDGDAFFVYANGIKQNAEAQSNVRVTGLAPNVSLRIEFANKTLPTIKQNTYDLALGMEHTFKIKRTRKQELVMRYFSQVPLAESNSGAAIPSVAYHETESQSQSAGYNTNTQSGAAITGGSNSSNDGNVSLSLQLGNVGFQVNVKDKSNSTTSNATINSSQSQNQSFNSAGQNPTGGSQAAITNGSNAQSPSNSQAAIPKGKNGCTAPMSADAFSKLKNAVEQKPFSDTRMSTAKIATKNNCLSTSQIFEICKLFSMDDDKLKYAQFAYDFCSDKANYYTLSEVFAFSTTQEKFNTFLDAK